MATIVLADDCDDLRLVYASCLRARGHDVHEAADGCQAVEMVRRFQPELLLLDIWMPGRNGFEVLDDLRFEPAAAHTRVLMLSVLSDGGTQLEAYGGGALDFLIKGLPLAEFVNRVESLLTFPSLSGAAASA